MKKLIGILTILAMFSFVTNDCKKLRNGNYKVQYDSLFEKYPSFSFTIENEQFILKQKDSVSNLKIEWLGNCAFRVEGFTKPKAPLSDLQKVFYSQEPFYEIISIKNDTASFIYRRNLHVQIYSGKFIRLKD